MRLHGRVAATPGRGLSLLRSWLATLRDRRDRLLVSSGFQRRALRLPIARRVARTRMRALFDLCSGFVYSQVLMACIRLDLFEIIADAPRTSNALAQRLDLPQPSMDRLLEAAESLDLVEARGEGRFGLGPLGAALLGNPAVKAMIEHHAALYEDLRDPVAILRGTNDSTALGRYWAYSKNAGVSEIGKDDTAAYTDLMAASQAMIADQVLSSCSFTACRRLLDVGGGAGAFVQAALERHAHLEGRVFDLPPVAAQARERFEASGLGERASAVGGSFLDDPLPRGHDLISLVRVLHDHDDDTVASLLKSVREAIEPGGMLVVAEPMLETRGAEPVTAAYFGFYLMAMGQGRARSADTLKTMLEAAGFGAVRERRTAAPLLVRVLTARPDAQA